MPDVGLMCVEGFADDKPAWAASIQMDLVSVVETYEGRGRRGFLFAPQVSLYFDIFTASLNLLYLFFSTYTACSALHTAWDLQCFSSLPFTSRFLNFVTLLWSMSEIVYFCGWMNDDFLSEWLQWKYCRLQSNVHQLVSHSERTYSSDKVLMLAVKAQENHVHFLSRKLVQAHKLRCT